MTRYIKVTPEAVKAARLHVEAYRSAGLTPDPVVEKMAEAKPRAERWVKEQLRRELVERTERINAGEADRRAADRLREAQQAAARRAAQSDEVRRRRLEPGV